MCDDAVRMVRPMMRIISADILTPYHGLVSTAVSNQCVIGLLIIRRLSSRFDPFSRSVERM